MDNIIKLLQKISAKDRDRIIRAIEILRSGNIDSLDIRKIVGTSYYRVRVGKYRIIFFYNELREIIVHSVNRRDDTTYNNV